MARSNEQPLKAVIEKLLETYKLADKLNEVDIIQSWNKIMGNIIAIHTTNLYISNKVLYVSLDSDALRQELSYAKKKIINMLTKEYKKPVITDIVFK